MDSSLLCGLVVAFSIAGTNGQINIPDPSSNKYLTYNFHSHCPNENLYRKEGTPGPCKEDQVAVEQTEFSQVSDSLNCEFSENTDCTTEVVDSGNYSSATGICVWSNASHPCYGYPANYRFFAQDGKCYSAQTSSLPQCKISQKFYSLNDSHGTCDCFRDETQATAYIYRPTTDECYQTNSQGPCSDGEWIVLDPAGKPTCVRTSCPADGTYVLYSKKDRGPACYKLHSEDPCTNEGIIKKVLHRVRVFPEKLECIRQKLWHFAIGQAKLRDHTCHPGSKLSIIGDCKKIF